MNILLENFSVIGRLVKDAEIVESKDGFRKALVFSLAVNHSYKNDNGEFMKHTNFYDTAKWYNKDNNIENQLSFLKKGALVLVMGFPKVHGYMNKDNKVEAKLSITVSQYSVLSFVNNESIKNENEVETEKIIYSSADSQ